VAQFIGRTQFLPGVVQARRDSTHVEVACALGLWVAPADPSLSVGDRALIVVRPEALQVLAAADVAALAAQGSVRGRVVRTYFLGGSVEHVLEFDAGVSLFAHTPPGHDLAPGAQAQLGVDLQQLWVLPDESKAP
jgi:ABC-type Fe3+/spermidine/putrescine transport system ATPase subunit